MALQNTFPRLRTLFQVAVGAGLLALLVAFVDPGELTAALRTASPGWAAVGFGWFAVMMGLDALRFQVAFRAYRFDYPTALRVQLVGLFLSNFTPGMSGTEVYRVYTAHRAERGLVRSITLAAVVRAVGVVSFALLASAYALAYGRRVTDLLEGRVTLSALTSPSTWIVVAAAGGLLFVAFAAVYLRSARWPATGFRELLSRIAESWRQLGLRAMAALVAVSLLMAGAGCLSLHALTRSMVEAPPPPDMIVPLTLLTVGSLLPISFGSLGVREGAVVVGLAALGVSGEIATVVALLHRGCLWLLSLAGGVVWLRTRHRQVGRHVPSSRSR